MAIKDTSVDSRTLWDQLAASVTGRRSWCIALVIVLISIAAMGLIGENDSAGEAPQSLPANADSAEVNELLEQFPDSDVAPAVLVVVRGDGNALSPADQEAVAAAQQRMLAVERSVPADSPAGPPVVLSPDQMAAISIVPVSADLNGFKLTDLVDELRAAADDGLPSDLTTYVTGGPAFGADTANSFSGANVTLLAVTALVVALLLIVTYRSPVLWLVPLIVVAFADRLASSVGTGLAANSPDCRSTAPPQASPASSCSAPAPTTPCCSSLATARNCAPSPTIESRCDGRSATPDRPSWRPTRRWSWHC